MWELEKHGQEIVFLSETDYTNLLMEEIIGKRLGLKNLKEYLTLLLIQIILMKYM